MDQPGLPADEHARALAGLKRINALSRTDAVAWRRIEPLARALPSDERPLRVLDVATGGGALPLAIRARARRAGLEVAADGCDVSPQAVEIAEALASARGSTCRFFALDALNDPLPEGYDVITCSLFLHHLDETEAVGLLGRMGAAARRLVLVDDLIRSSWGYLLAAAGCRLLSRSPIVHEDGPTSVAGAFTPDEALDLARRAGLRGATIDRHWPQRFLLSWRRPTS